MERLHTVGIVGVGLIGASLGMAMRRRELVERVVGVDIDPQAIATARERGAIDDGGGDLALLWDADVVALAVHPDAVIDVALQAAVAMKSGSILIDVASTKARIVRTLDQKVPRHVRYIGGHPMAGSEERGAEAADADLLDGRPFLLTPTEHTDPAAVAVMTELVGRLGMLPVLLAPEDHDELVAQVSHLPYLLAVAAVRAASDRAIEVRGPAFSRIGRIAGSPAELWAQICRGNRAAIKRALVGFRRELDRLEQALDDGELEAILEKTRQRARMVDN